MAPWSSSAEPWASMPPAVVKVHSATRRSICRTWPGAHSRLLLDPQGVEWSRVAGFEVPPPYGTLLKSGIRVRLHGGRLLSANACAYGGIDEFAFVKTRRARVIEEL